MSAVTEERQERLTLIVVFINAAMLILGGLIMALEIWLDTQAASSPLA